MRPASPALLLALLACTRASPRASCERDAECPDAAVCYLDGRCLPASVARRLPSPPGDECAARGGVERGCLAGLVCRLGRCTGPGGCGDPRAPRFAGARDVLAGAPGAIEVVWDAAQDDATPPELMTYRVLLSTEAGGPGTPVLAVVGQLRATISGLAPGGIQHVRVRSEDGDGRTDCNEVEIAAAAGAEGCVDWAGAIEPLLGARCTGCHGGAEPAARLDLTTLEGALRGGVSAGAGRPAVTACRAEESLLVRKVADEKPPVGARMPLRAPPLDGAAVALLRGWIDQGARRRCSDPGACGDAIPPSAPARVSAVSSGPTAARVCWDPATDDVTPRAALTYEIFLGGAPSPHAISAPGAGCLEAAALVPGQRACFEVRARDAAGNRSGPGDERCVDVPPLPPGCVDYATVIAPILERHCTRCHEGPLAPMRLQLDGHARVMEGGVRRDAVRACDVAGSRLLRKLGPTPPSGQRMPAGGEPLADAQVAALAQWVATGARESCGEPASCDDGEAPGFAGVREVRPVDPTSLEVCWDSADDPSGPVRYEIFEGAVPGGEDLAGPAPHAVVGAACATVAVAPETSLCFVVRARDRRGNADANRVERCATTPARPGCTVDHPRVAGILSARCLHCHAGPDAPRRLDMSSPAAILAGGTLGSPVAGCSWERSLMGRKLAGATCGRRMPGGGPWLPPSETALLAAWIATGARASCADPDPCADATPPAFAGLRSAELRGPDEVLLCWDAATDASSATVAHDVWAAAAPGEEPLEAPAHYAAGPGDACLAVRVPPGRTSCFVVRARDAAGHRDANRVEACVTPPPACVDWDSAVGPLLRSRCVQCHQGPIRIRWDTYAHVMQDGLVVRCDPQASAILGALDACRMPRDTSAELCETPACLPPPQAGLVRAWIESGAPERCGSGRCP